MLLSSLFDVASEIIHIHRHHIDITLFLLVCGCCVGYFIHSLSVAIPVLAVGVSKYGLLVCD